MDYKAKKRAFNIMSITWAALNSIGLLAIVIFIIIVRTRYTDMFNELGVELPRITQFVFDMPAPLFRPVWFIIVLISIKEFIDNKRMKIIVNLCFSFFLFGLATLLFIPLFLPLIELKSSLSQ